jgi:hypothetical protein
MTNFEDQLFSDLMTEHGAQLPPGRGPATDPSAAPRRLWVRRPVWLATGAATGVAAAATAVALTLGGTAPAYAVSRGADGSVQVSVSKQAGVAGANAALHRMKVRVRVVVVRPGCPPISSLPHPKAVHGQLRVSAGRPKNGHRPVSVKVSSHGIPAGATVVLAFSAHGRTSLGASGFITGPVPTCVSLPAAPGH